MANTDPSSTSTSRNDTSLEYEELNKKQRLKAALYYGIKQISKEVEEEMEVRINSQVLATACESLGRQAEIYAKDLELFAKHCKRTNVNIDDVKLLARRNEQLLDHLNDVVADHTSEKDAKKKQRKNTADKPRSKKATKSGSSSSAAMNVNVDDS